MNWWERILFGFLMLALVLAMTAARAWFWLSVIAVYGLLVAGADLDRTRRRRP